MIKIDNEFKKLIPPLSIDEFKQLEENILSEGIRENIIVWNNVIIDGHNRYEIAMKHGLEFKTAEKSFTDKNDVKIWIIKNQFGRRNLALYDRGKLALMLKPLISEKAKQKQKEAGGAVRQISDKAVIDTKKELAKVAGMSHDTIFKIEQIEKKATDEVKEKLSSGEISINQVYQDIKKEEKKNDLKEKQQEYTEKITSLSAEKKEFKIDIFETDKKFRVFYVDPPWNYGDKQNTPNLGGAEKHYDSMTIDQLCDLPVDTLSEKDAVLFLWVTSPLLEECFDIIKAWGFKYKSSFIWDKVKHNMGHYNSVRHEFLLICTKGKCTPDEKKLSDSVQSIERTEKHSEKPVEFMNIIDELYTHGDRIELFCRQPKKENWFYWGNEVWPLIIKRN